MIRKHITRPLCSNIYVASKGSRSLPSLPCVRLMTNAVFISSPSAPRRFYSTTFPYKTPQENQKVVTTYIQTHLPQDDHSMITFLDNFFNCALLLHNAEKHVPFSHVVSMLQQCTELFPVEREKVMQIQQQQQQLSHQLQVMQASQDNSQQQQISQQLQALEDSRRSYYFASLQRIVHQANIFEKEKSTHVGLLVKAVCTQYCGDLQGALALFKQLSQESASSSETKFEIYALCAMASIEFSQNRQDEALKLIESAIALDTQNGYSFQLKAVYLANQGKFEDANSVISRAIQVEPQNSALYSLRGFMKTSMGKAKEALEDFIAAVRMQPSIPEPRLPLALHYIMQFNDLTNGLVELETSFIVSGNDTSLIWSNVNSFLESTKSHPRSEVIQLIVQGMLGSRMAEVQKHAIPADKRAEFVKANMQNFDEAVAKEPNQEEPLFFRALARAEAKDVQGAVQDLNRALTINPLYYQAYSYRATLATMENLNNEAMLKEKFNEIQQDFEKAIAISPDYYDAYWNRSTLLLMLRKGEEALKDVNKAIELRPYYSSTQYYKRAHISLLLEQDAQALEDYGTAIEIHPEAPHLYKERAHLLRKMGKEDEAKRDEQEYQRIQNAMQQYMQQQQFQQKQQQAQQMQQAQQANPQSSTSSAPHQSKQ